MKPALASAPLFASLAACAALIKQAAHIPLGWKQIGTVVNPSQKIQFSIALRQPNIGGLRSLIGRGKDFLSLDQIHNLRAPSQDDVDCVIKWLADNGISDAKVEDEWIVVQTTVAKAEPLLAMKLQHFAFDHHRGTFLRTTQYTVPDSVRDSIDFIHPINNFMVPKHSVKDFELISDEESKASSFHTESAAAGPVCQNQVNPACLKQLYNITYDAHQESDAIIGVASFLEQYISSADVDAFLRAKAPEVAGRNFTVELVNNGQNNQSDPGVEASLDMDYVMSLSAPANTVFYSTAGRGVRLDDDGKPLTGDDDNNEPYLEFLDYLLKTPYGKKLPHVLSISYGDDELSVPAEYADKVCASFGLLTARGVSVIVSSGDGGSAGGGGQSTCLTNDGKKRQVAMGTFPSACEWVTSVGSTENTQEPPAGAVFSSGGFSQHYPRPAWQNGPGLVDDYVKELNGHLQGKYDPSKRAFPDVSVVGVKFAVTIHGQQALVGGTSASAPTFASMIALIVDARLKRGKRPLGWLNEVLYSERLRHVYQDITQGTSTSCTWDGVSPGGWPALKGWDAMTGLGVPNDFDKLFKALIDV